MDLRLTPDAYIKGVIQKFRDPELGLKYDQKFIYRLYDIYYREYFREMIKEHKKQRKNEQIKTNR